jgi:hypothetical protein
MSETHTDIIVFWWHCIRTGWGIGYGIFDAVVTICLLASAGVSLFLFLFKKYKPKKWKWEPWEDNLMKIAFVIFSFTFIIVAVLVGPFREYHEMENESNSSKKTVEILSSSNSYFNGVIEGNKTTVQNLQKELEDNRRDAATANLNSKTDLNEANRQRDVALQRLDFFEANPEKLFNIYSNIFTHTPTNFAQFDLEFQQFTNVLNDIRSERPKLVLYVNGVLQLTVDNAPGAVVPGGLVFTKKTNSLVFRVHNLSKITASHIKIAFFAPIDPTNVTAVGWSAQPASEFGRNQWVTTAESSTGQFVSFQASPITISTNFQNPTLQAMILFYADNSVTYESVITFVFQ